MPTIKKKSLKAKISGTFLIKKAVAEAKHLSVNHLVDNLVDVIDSIFFQIVKNQANYKDCVLAYYYRLFLIFCDFN